MLHDKARVYVSVGRVSGVRVCWAGDFSHKKMETLKISIFLIKTALAVVGQDDVAIKITNTADGFTLFIKAKFAD